MKTIPYIDSGGVHILSKISLQFEELYLRAMRKENRVYSDAEVKELPNPFFYNLHRQEWEMRKKSSSRLLNYLRKIQGESRVLDLGCGNGWLTDRIARMEQFEVWGIDVNLFELQQASRVFNRPNLHYAYGDIFENLFPATHFDCIILNQSIEFFSDLPQLINRCRYFLKPGGEIHIMDSPIHPDKELDSARKQFLQHWDAIGIPEISTIHFHHPKSSLNSFDFQFLYKPRRFFGKQDSPYPWVRIIN